MNRSERAFELVLSALEHATELSPRDAIFFVSVYDVVKTHAKLKGFADSCFDALSEKTDHNCRLRAALWKQSNN